MYQQQRSTAGACRGWPSTWAQEREREDWATINCCITHTEMDRTVSTVKSEAMILFTSSYYRQNIFLKISSIGTTYWHCFLILSSHSVGIGIDRYDSMFKGKKPANYLNCHQKKKEDMPVTTSPTASKAQTGTAGNTHKQNYPIYWGKKPISD